MPAHQTAISRKGPSAPMKWLDKQGLLAGGRRLDFGCGRGADADHFGMDGFDPHWRPEEPTGHYDLVTCNYVLNVIGRKEQGEVLARVERLLKPGGGRAFFSVRRDLPREGKSGRGCYQRFVTLDLPLITENGSFAVYEMRGCC